MDLPTPADAVRHPLSGLRPGADAAGLGTRSDLNLVDSPDVVDPDVVDRPDVKDIVDRPDAPDFVDVVEPPEQR